MNRLETLIQYIDLQKDILKFQKVLDLHPNESFTNIETLLNHHSQLCAHMEHDHPWIVDIIQIVDA